MFSSVGSFRSGSVLIECLPEGEYLASNLPRQWNTGVFYSKEHRLRALTNRFSNKKASGRARFRGKCLDHNLITLVMNEI